MKTPSAFRRRVFYAATLVVFASSMLVQPFASIASADNQAGPFISDTLREDVVDRQLLLYMFECLGSQLIVSPEDITAGSLTGSKTEAARGGMFVYETRACNNTAAANGPGEILNRLGITDFVDFFCGLPSVYNTNTGGLGKTIAGGDNKAACKRGVNVPDSFFSTVSSNGNLKQDIITAISKKPRGKDAAGAFRFDKRYVQLWQTWARGCSEARLTNPYPTDSDPAANNPSVFRIPVVNQNGEVKDFVADSGNAKIDSKKVYLAEEYQDPANATAPPGSEYSFYPLPTCGRIAEWMRATADAYGRYLATHEGETGGTTTLPDDTSPTEDGEATSCAVDGIGWIVCPVMGFVAKVNDSAFAFLKSFLGIRPSLINSDGTQNAWKAFRDIANVAFVIAFLVIVYSQITSAGISNYGIKKMLPRIVIAAILVNLSYFICALMVDVSNILGSSIYSLLKSFDVGATGGDPSWQTIISGPDGILATAAFGIAIVLLAIAVFLAPTTLLAFAVVILILIARQAFVILLIVISPLAFVAYLLPNTEDWFKKWWKALMATLMVYPIIGAVFGASTLAANILSSTAKTTDDSSLLQLIALGVLAVPLFAVPALLKGSMSAAGSVGQKLAGLQDRANRRGLRGVKEGRLGEAKAAWDRNRQNNKFKRRTGSGRLATWGKDREGIVGKSAAWIGTRQQAFDSSKVGAKLGGTRGAAVATQGIFKQYDEDVAAFKTTMSGKSNEALIEMIKTSSLSSEQRAAAAGMIMSRDHREAHLQALHAVGQATRAAEAEGNTSELGTLSDVQKQMSHDMKDKPWALGDQAAGQLVEGVYGRSVNHEGKSQQQFGDINEEIKDRVGKKLSAASIAKMNPDEMNHIMDSALGNELNEEQLANLQASIKAARANPQMNDLIKTQEAKKHQAILDYIAQNHPGVASAPTPSPTAPSSPATTPPTNPTPAGGGASPLPPVDHDDNPGVL